ncbi:MAG TPA: DUF932 domain-containing protein [Bryobacteraceae bacterium]|jgi:hypothetical protein
MEQLIAHVGASKLSRDQLVTILPPEATDTFKPIAHSDLIGNVLEALSYRHINVVKDEYAVSEDGMKLFGVLDLESSFEGCRFSLGLRNANDKSMRLALTIGYRVFVCDNMAFHGDFTPVLAKHSKHFNLQDALAIGIDRMQRNFEPMRKQVESWRNFQLTDAAAKLVIYRAFIEDDLEAPKYLSREVHRLYFDPQYPEFQPRTLWSLSNAFTSAFKELDPVPQFKATAKLGGFLASMN